MKVFIDGAIVDGKDARISVMDHGLLYGDGVFEGIRAWGGKVFRLDDHLSRLSYGSRALHMELPYSKAELADIVQRTVDAFGEDEAYIRLLVTRGVGPLGIDTHSCEAPNVVCMVDGLKIFPKEKQLSGVSLHTSGSRRANFDAIDSRIKSLNYLTNVMARVQARRSGADEALLLNQAGHVAEASVANVFVVQDGVLITPPTTDGSLDGITRRTVLELAESMGIPTQVRSITRTDFFIGQDAFLSGTGAGIVRVSSLDGQAIGGREPSSIMVSILDGYVERRSS